MRPLGWMLFIVGLALVLYGKYFREPLFRVSGIVVTMVGAMLMTWPWQRKERDGSN